MTEEQTTNVTNTETPVDTTSATPVAAVVPPSSQQPTTPGLDSSVFDSSDGKPWRKKFYGQKGRADQLEQEAAKAEGALTEQVNQLQQSLQIAQAEVQRLTLLSSELTGKVDAIPQLQTDNQNLKQEAAVAERMKVLLDYPGLLGMKVEEVVPATEEGQEPTTVAVNPVLNLAANTTLDIDALKAELDRLAKFQGMPATPPVEPPSSGPPVAPAPAAPSEETAEYWRQKGVELSLRMNTEGQLPELMNAHTEAWKKHTELLASG